MELNLELAFNEAVNEIARLNKELIMERTARKQLQSENAEIKEINENMERRLHELEQTICQINEGNQNE